MNTREISLYTPVLRQQNGHSPFLSGKRQMDLIWCYLFTGCPSGSHRAEEVPLYQNPMGLEVTSRSTCLSGNGIIQSYISSCNHEGGYKKKVWLSTHYTSRNLFHHSLTSLVSTSSASFCCKCIHRWDMPTGSVSILSLSFKDCSPASVNLSDLFTETIISLLSWVLSV